MVGLPAYQPVAETGDEVFLHGEPQNDQRHDGKWNTSRYRLVAAATLLTVNDPYVRIEGLQLEVTKTGDWARAVIAFSG